MRWYTYKSGFWSTEGRSITRQEDDRWFVIASQGESGRLKTSYFFHSGNQTKSQSIAGLFLIWSTQAAEYLFLIWNFYVLKVKYVSAIWLTRKHILYAYTYMSQHYMFSTTVSLWSVLIVKVVKQISDHIKRKKFKHRALELGSKLNQN